MSTPPRVDLPEGVVVEQWSVRGSHRGVMHAGLRECDSWAVFVPGFTGSKEDFISVLPLLADAGVGAVAFDHLGQHESHASSDPDDYDLGHLAADIGGIIDEVRRRFGRDDDPHVVGHSFGGLVAQRALIDGHARPATFVALCSGPGALPEVHWEPLQALVDALPHTGLDDIWELMKSMEAASGASPAAPEIEEFLRRRWLGHSPVHLRELARVLMEQAPMDEHMRVVVADGTPVTVMWGERDDKWPPSMQAAMAREWGAVGVEIADTGHSPNADRPEALVEALLQSWGRAGQ